ncbi:hypothetical protein [Aquamicrobium terrae]|uniref:Phage tail protein n=1 Tax=Aquamicrobium terrae TaxID=1324945 RepID=A0ABV2MTS8_9HYPH
MKIFLPLATSLAMACAIASPADAVERLPDGVYHCEVYLLGQFLSLGDITIKGNVYTGPSYFPVPQQGYNYQIEPNDEISWLGPLGGFTSGGNSISLTQVTSRDPRSASFDIIMRQPDGAFTASTCTIR